MEPILIFYGAWTIEVTRLFLGAGSPVVRLILVSTGTVDGTYPNPPVGTRMEADGPQWILKVEISFDLLPFQGIELTRDFVFDPQLGMTATVTGRRQTPSFRADIALRLTAHDSELGARPAQPYDFTVPKGVHPREG